MSSREKTLLSIPATHPLYSDVSHIDVLVDFYDGQYSLVLQPYNRNDSLHSQVSAYGKNPIGAKIPLLRAKRFSAVKLKNLHANGEQWTQLSALIDSQNFTLPTSSRETLDAIIMNEINADMG